MSKSDKKKPLSRRAKGPDPALTAPDPYRRLAEELGRLVGQYLADQLPPQQQPGPKPPAPKEP